MCVNCAMKSIGKRIHCEWKDALTAKEMKKRL